MKLAERIPVPLIKSSSSPFSETSGGCNDTILCRGVYENETCVSRYVFPNNDTDTFTALAESIGGVSHLREIEVSFKETKKAGTNSIPNRHRG
jgi:hypothetical protein